MKITGSAIRSEGDSFYWLLKPNRHHNVIALMAECGEKTPISGEQGFLLDNGEFIGRVEARELALKTGQCKNPRHQTLLFSEDLW